MIDEFEGERLIQEAICLVARQLKIEVPPLALIAEVRGLIEACDAQAFTRLAQYENVHRSYYKRCRDHRKNGIVCKDDLDSVDREPLERMEEDCDRARQELVTWLNQV